MTEEERKALEECAEKIIVFAKTQQNPKEAVADLLTNIALNAMGEERVEWELAINILGVKTKEKLLKARFKNEN